MFDHRNLFTFIHCSTDTPSCLEEGRIKKAKFLVRGYYKKDKNLSIYSQILNIDTGKIIDAINVSDEIQGLENLALPEEEMNEKDSNRISDFSRKLIIRLRSNPERNENRGNVDEYILNSPVITHKPELKNFIIKEDLNVASEEVFKLLEEQIVVTATKKEERLSDAPASMTVITREDIERYGYRSLSEALARVSKFMCITSVII